MKTCVPGTQPWPGRESIRCRSERVRIRIPCARVPVGRLCSGPVPRTQKTSHAAGRRCTRAKCFRPKGHSIHCCFSSPDLGTSRTWSGSRSPIRPVPYALSITLIHLSLSYCHCSAGSNFEQQDRSFRPSLLQQSVWTPVGWGLRADWQNC